MKTNRVYFSIFEGLSNVGKSSIIQEVKKQLETEGNQVFFISANVYEDDSSKLSGVACYNKERIGNALKETIKVDENQKISPIHYHELILNKTALFAEVLGGAIKLWKKTDKDIYILMDRSIFSTYVYMNDEIYDTMNKGNFTYQYSISKEETFNHGLVNTTYLKEHFNNHLNDMARKISSLSQLILDEDKLDEIYNVAKLNVFWIKRDQDKIQTTESNNDTDSFHDKASMVKHDKYIERYRLIFRQWSAIAHVYDTPFMNPNHFEQVITGKPIVSLDYPCIIYNNGTLESSVENVLKIMKGNHLNDYKLLFNPDHKDILTLNEVDEIKLGIERTQAHSNGGHS